MRANEAGDKTIADQKERLRFFSDDLPPVRATLASLGGAAESERILLAHGEKGIGVIGRALYAFSFALAAGCVTARRPGGRPAG